MVDKLMYIPNDNTQNNPFVDSILIEMFESKYQKQQQNARKDGAKLCRSEIIKLCDLLIQRPLYQMFVAATIWSIAAVTMLFQNVATQLLGLYPRPSGLGFLLYL